MAAGGGEGGIPQSSARRQLNNGDRPARGWIVDVNGRLPLSLSWREGGLAKILNFFLSLFLRLVMKMKAKD